MTSDPVDQQPTVPAPADPESEARLNVTVGNQADVDEAAQVLSGMAAASEAEEKPAGSTAIGSGTDSKTEPASAVVLAPSKRKGLANVMKVWLFFSSGSIW